MGEEAYNKKIADLQKHIPFLENMILQLKDPKGKPREAQLSKMESLYSMITDRNKKWKYETLLKCEEVIQKLQTKVKANRPSLVPDVKKGKLKTKDRVAAVSQTVNEIMNALKFSNARAKLNCEMSTPKSPSPVREIVKHSPRIIPFEATETKNKSNIDPNEFDINTWTNDDDPIDRYVKEKPDIYSSAAKSLTIASPNSTVFTSLAPTIPEVSKPLLSDADLQLLTAGDDYVCAEQTDQSNETKSKEKSVDLNLSKVTPRIVPVPSSRPKSPKLECGKDEKHPIKSKSPKVEKLKDCNVFGDILSSIDSKLLEDNKKKDKRKDEKKHSDYHKKDKHKKQSKHKDHKDSHKHEKHKSDKHSKSEKQPESDDKTASEKSDKAEEKPVLKTDSNEAVVTNDKPVRLADKYNPKPRRQTVDEKPVTESSPKTDEFKVKTPLLDIETRDPRLRQHSSQVIPSLLDLNLPKPISPIIPPLIAQSTQKRPENNNPPTDPRRPVRYSPPTIRPSTAYPNVNYTNYLNPQPIIQSSFNQPSSRSEFNSNLYPNTNRMGFQGYNGAHYQNNTSRYDLSSRFEPPESYNSNLSHFNNGPPRKNFCPFEPLSNDNEDETNDCQTNSNYSNTSRLFHDDGYRRGGYQSRPGKFSKYNYVRQDRQFDRNVEKDGYNRSFSKRDQKPSNNEHKLSVSSNDDDDPKEILKCKDIPRTKYDEIYSKLENDKETFTSPLECLYSTPKSSAKPMQSFKIPKKPKPETVVKDSKDSKIAEIKEKRKSTKNDNEKTPKQTTDDDSDDEPIKPIRKRVSNRKAKTIARKKLIEDSDEEEDEDLKSELKELVNEEREYNEQKEEVKKIDSVPKSCTKDTKTETKKDEAQLKIVTKKELKVEAKKESKITQKELKVEMNKELKVEAQKVLKVEVKKELQKELKNEVREEKVEAREESNVEKDSNVENASEQSMENKDEGNTEKADTDGGIKGKAELDDKRVLEFILENYEKIKKMFHGTEDDKDDKGEKDLGEKATSKGETSTVEESINVEESIESKDVAVSKAKTKKPLKRGPKGKMKLPKIQSRITRNKAKIVMSKKSRRSELDKLHDDIKEMLMGGDVLTSSGKRSCTMKDDEFDLPKKPDSDENASLTSLVSRSKLRAKSANLRVLIEKTDLGKLLCNELQTKDESVCSGNETDSSVFKSTSKSSKSDSFEIDLLEQESTDTSSSSLANSKLLKKKKRINNWASGVIRKKRKRRTLQKSDDGELGDGDGVVVQQIASEDGSIDSFETTPNLEPVSTGIHDINYYPAESKPECRLCPFKGKFIVQHYKNIHPESEVLISRMNPKVSQDLIKTSIERNYESVVPVDTFMDDLPSKKIKFNFKCGFCEVPMCEYSEVFYDHVASHTGEFRFFCVFCTFKTSSVKNLRAHISSNHNRSTENCAKATWPPPPNFKFVFGYICKTCNYVQLSKEAIEDHVKVHAHGPFYKISMSVTCEDSEVVVTTDTSCAEQKLPNVVDKTNAIVKADIVSEHVMECIERVVNNEASVSEPTFSPSLRRRPGRPPSHFSQVRDLSVFELISEMAEVDKSEKDSAKKDEKIEQSKPECVVIKTEPEDVAELDETHALEVVPSKPVEEKEIKEEVVEKPIEEKRKSPDLTVFMCDAELMVDEQSIEENRLKKMKEINETIQSSRTTIADKLQSWLQTVDVHEVVTPPPLQPIDAPPPLVPIDRFKKTIDLPTKKDTPMKPMSDDVVPEKVGQISNIINRLQDQLVTNDKDTADLPPLIHYRDLSADGTYEFIILGPVKLMAKRGQVLFGCLVPTCVFCSDNRTVFETHCKVTHEHFPVSLTVPGKCDICNIKIDYEKNYVSMLDVFNHLMSSHHNFFKKFEIESMNVFKLPHEVPNVISQGNSFPFMITSVTSLAPIKKPESTKPEDTEKIQLPKIQSVESLAPKKVPEIRAVPLSQLCGTTNANQAKTVSTVTVPSPPIILNSLLPQASKNLVLSPVTKKNVRPILPAKPSTGDSPPPKRIVLRDIPMKGDEIMRPRKSASALVALLTSQKIRQLFKCPEYNCTYTTDYSIEFNKHLNTHVSLKDQLTPCLYCDYKIHIENYSIHVELKHGNCEYGCEYCLYRATCAYFVIIHNEMKHPHRTSKIMQIKILPSNLRAISGDEKQPLRKLLMPYICGQPGCNFKTLFTDDFSQHLSSLHREGCMYPCSKCSTKGISSPSGMIFHWTIHRVYFFHCRHCAFGAKTMDEIGRHQASVHFSVPYGVTCRVFVKSSSYLTQRSFTFDEDSMFDRLLKLPEQATTPEGKDVMKSNRTIRAYFDGNGMKESTVLFPPMSTPPTPSTFKLDDIEVIRMVEPDNFTKNDDKQSPTQKNTETQNPYEEPVILTNDMDNSNEVDPLSLEGVEDNEKSSETETTNKQNMLEINLNLFEDSNDDYIDIEGEPETKDLVGTDLYKCKCLQSFPSSHVMKLHVIECQKRKPFYCGHCTRTCKTVHGLMTHYQEHGRTRFKCSLCPYKNRHPVGVRNHMKVVHNVTRTMLLPVVCKKDNVETDDFVLRPKQQQNQLSSSDSGSKTSLIDETPNAENKLVFSPHEINLLPRQPIYQTDVKCGVCVYATKVKSNMVRHLLFHQTEQDVPVIAPVNPVPCLEKSEKMFDKMVNLAASSHTPGRISSVKNEKVPREENVNIPQYVPQNQRYVCGAENCNYLCPEEAMLRRHLTAFHAQEASYSCLHCNIKISEEKTLNIESVMKHLKLHDLLLYQCGHCKFLHNLKHKVERHLVDKHLNKPPSLIIIRELEKEPVEQETETEKDIKEHKPWKCGMCKYRCGTIIGMKTHCSNKHNIESKYKCTLCDFKSEDKADFQDHFDINHIGHKVNYIVCYFNDDKSIVQKPEPEVEFNTAPLWQRNKSVKHIRGILLEETSNAKMLKMPTLKKMKVLKPKRSDDGDKSDEMASPSPTPDKTDLTSDRVPVTPPKNSPSLITVASFAKLTANKTQKKCKNNQSPKNKIIKVGGIKIGEFKGSNTDEVIDITSDDTDASQTDESTNPKEIIDKAKKSILNKMNDASPTTGNMNINNGNMNINDTVNTNETLNINKTINGNETVIINENVNVSESVNEIRIINESVTSSRSSVIVDPDQNNTESDINDDIADVNNLLEDTLRQCQTVLDKNLESAKPSDLSSEEPNNENLLTAAVSEETPANLRNIKLVSIRSLTEPENSDSTTAEENNVETIEIDDESDASSPKRKKTDLTMKQIKKMTKEELVNGNFVGTYGPFGSPWNGMYKCPLCEKLTFKTEKQFSIHLYKELDYGTFKCKICNFTGITPGYVKKHYQNKHGPVVDSDIIQTTWDSQIEIWIHKVIAFQGRILSMESDVSKESGSSQKRIQEPATSPNVKMQYCMFCEYRCKYSSDLKKHEARHWSVKRYKCSYCTYDGLNKSTMLMHHQRVHKDKEVKMTECEIGSSVIIKRVKITKRKSSLPTEDVTDLFENESDLPYDLAELNDAKVDVNGRHLQADLLKCCYCPFIGVFSDQKKHHSEEHQELTLSVYRYKCNYCDTTFITLLSLNKHFFTKHPGMQQDFANVVAPTKKPGRYQCPVCYNCYNEYDKIQYHIRSHVKPFQCIYCDMVFSYWHQIQKHHNENHFAFTYEYRYLLNLENEISTLFSNIKRNDKEISTRKRKLSSDLDDDDDDVLFVDENVEEPNVKKQKVPELPVKNVKNTARKSTSCPNKIEGFSYYGNKPDDTDLKTIHTTVEIMGASLTMSVEQLSNIFNLFPQVSSEDCGKNAT